MRTLLALNNGSSSLKFGLYAFDSADLQVLLDGELDGLGTGHCVLRWADSGSNSGAHSGVDTRPGAARQEQALVGTPSAQAAMQHMDAVLAASGHPPPQAIGHRIVHGGPNLHAHCLLDAAVLAEIEAAASFAPVHTPAALQIIRHSQAHHPGVPQVACFDTSFHADLPEWAQRVPLPSGLRAHGLRRYGFHGLSCESIVQALGAALPQRLVIAHLGNGASVTAVLAGRSIDTSMGLTPTGGVLMGSRSGDLDPGLLLWLLREQGLDAAALAQLVDHESGLLALSGLSGDMRALHAAAATHPDAALTIDMFCRAVCKAVAGMVTSLGGIDALVFTGGIGEHDAACRGAICQGLSGLGIQPTGDSRCRVQVLASQKDAMIARHTARLVGALRAG